METSLKYFRFSEIITLIPDTLIPILITLALSFLIGLEREEHSAGGHYNFGGVRTFPIIGLCGYMLAKLTEAHSQILSAGVLVLGALLWLSYRKKLELSSSAGMTSEVSGFFTFLLGASIFHGALWEATTLTVIVLLLLELKSGLESLARKISSNEIFTFTRFLLISAVILPIVPNRDFTILHLNPFHTWLIVVAISSLSYIAYVLGKLLGSGQSIVLTAILGGIYSSTSTTIVLAKRSKDEKSSKIYSGAIVIASGFMYFRLVVLLSVFNWNLGKQLVFPFICLGILFTTVGVWYMTLEKQKFTLAKSDQIDGRNPLELQAAFIFAFLFTAMGVLTAVTFQYLGSGGIYGLSFLTGLTDVDPFVMSLTERINSGVGVQMAAKAIVIAAASNNIMKGIYAAIWGANDVRKQASLLLISLAIISLVALFFV